METTKKSPENFGAYQSGTSKIRRGTQAPCQSTLGRSLQAVKSMTPITGYEEWTLPRRNTLDCTRNGTQDDEEEELDSAVEVDTKVECSVKEPL